MTAIASFASITPHLNSQHRSSILLPKHSHRRICRFRCNGSNPASNSRKKLESEPQNALLKVAWYSSELLGIAASIFRSPSIEETTERALELAGDGSGAVDHTAVVETIKEDFERSYFVTGLHILSSLFYVNFNSIFSKQMVLNVVGCLFLWTGLASI